MSARIDPPARRSLLVRVVNWVLRRKLGKVPTPFAIAAHHGGIFMAHVRMEKAQLGARKVPAAVKQLAELRTSTLVGCPF